MADSRSSKEGSVEVGHGSATGSSSPTDDSSHSSPSKVGLSTSKIFLRISNKNHNLNILGTMMTELNQFLFVGLSSNFRKEWSNQYCSC